MRLGSDDAKTDRRLLQRVARWNDDSAWTRFDDTYRPMIRRWGQSLGFEGDDLDELCQMVILRFLHRAEGFDYDPSKTFRGWLRTVLRSQVVELVRSRRQGTRSLPSPDDLPDDGADRLGDESTPRDLGGRLADLAESVQDAVKERVSPENWRVFWMIRVEGSPVAEAARAVGKSYAAAYRNQERIARMLREEARARLGSASASNSTEPG
ncbi:RNA polymerase sigma factor [Tautonia rosea]|uniref:RNA polymerase sigma factor n=1 Tax=Tautonia rosea TaxID=2728037 RepID=UPI0014751AC9|nr:sigma-70 family RNA polymerase sigma factor [Tautonia rosea]